MSKRLGFAFLIPPRQMVRDISFIPSALVFSALEPSLTCWLRLGFWIQDAKREFSDGTEFVGFDSE
jgi:hypothetical protein